LIELEINEGFNVMNISLATVKRFIIKKPNGTILTKDAVFTTNGQDGLIHYHTMLGDLDLPGDYKIQSYLETPTFSGYSSITGFSVILNLG
jgi:hypothetical protein